MGILQCIQRGTYDESKQTTENDSSHEVPWSPIIIDLLCLVLPSILSIELIILPPSEIKALLNKPPPPILPVELIILPPSEINPLLIEPPPPILPVELSILPPSETKALLIEPPPAVFPMELGGGGARELVAFTKVGAPKTVTVKIINQW